MADKFHVILDLDETLVHHLDRKQWDTIPESERKKYRYYDEGTSGIYIIRPFAYELLEYLFKTCVVSIWTWASAPYALTVAKLLTGDRPEKFETIWSADDANFAKQMHGKSKDLNYIWYILDKPDYQQCNTILVDNLVENTRNHSNFQNSILVPDFDPFDVVLNGIYKDFSKDRALLSVLEIIKDVVTKANGNFDFWTPFGDVQIVRKNGGRRRRTTLKRLQKRGK